MSERWKYKPSTIRQVLERIATETAATPHQGRDPQVENARIERADVEIEDHDILTVSVGFTFAGGGQSLQAHFLDVGQGSALAVFTRGLLDTLGQRSLSGLRGVSCRVVRHPNGLLCAVGHFLDDRWFYPRHDLQEAL